MSEFTGYINLDGKHIKNGLTNRPLAFQVLEDRLVELRWLVNRDGKRYEISKQYEFDMNGIATPKRESVMKEGIIAGAEFNAYIESIIDDKCVTD